MQRRSWCRRAHFTPLLGRFNLNEHRAERFPLFVKLNGNEAISHIHDALGLPLKNGMLPRPVLQKDLKQAQRWIQQFKTINGYDYYCSLVGLGTMPLDECIEITSNAVKRNSQVELALIESLLQNLVIRDGLDEAQLFADHVQNTFNIAPTLNWNVILCQGALEKGDTLKASQLYTKLRRQWWPIPRQSFTFIISSILDAMLETQRSLNEKYPQSDSVQRYLSLLGWVVSSMQRQQIKSDLDQYLVLIVGLSQAGLLQEAFLQFRCLLEDGLQPNGVILNYLTSGIASYSSDQDWFTSDLLLNRNKANAVLCTYMKGSINQMLTTDEILDHMLYQFSNYNQKPDMHTVATLVNRYRKDTQKLTDFRRVIDSFYELDFYHQQKIGRIFKNKYPVDKWQHWTEALNSMGQFPGNRQRISWVFLP